MGNTFRWRLRNSEAFAKWHEIKQDMFGKDITIITCHGLPKESPDYPNKNKEELWV